MHRARLYSLTIAALLSIPTANSTAQSVMTHHVREATRNGQAQSLGRLASTQTMNLDLVLPLRDPVGLQNFLADLYGPTSASFHRFLTVEQFTQRFGPTQQDYNAAVTFAETHGLTVVGGSRDGMDIQVRATVAAVEAAFHINIGTFRHPTENRTFYAPDSEPTVDLPFNLWHISGLDNFSTPQPMLTKRSDFAEAHGIASKNVVSHATTGSGPSASFLGSDMRAAYYGGSTLTGAGQNLGLLEFVGTDLADLNTYFSNIGQTNTVPISLISTDGSSTSCFFTKAGGNCDDTEQNLDMTQALGMAPNLKSLVVFVGNSDTAIISAMTSRTPLVTTIGCSWGWTPVDPGTLDPYFKRMAAQGQNFFAASGDNSTWSRTPRAQQPWPADDPYVVSVGGTDLVTSSPGGPWQSETAWVYSGGGISPNSIAIPSWQKLSGVINSSNRGSTTLRNGPDVSANADFTFYTCANQTTCLANEYGGTSFAAPMWAAYMALVNQQLAINNQPPIGFINPTIYAQNVTSSYASNFHDILSGTSGSYSAVTGFDLVTGWGSPTPNLITALASGTSTPPPPTPTFSLSASGGISVRAGGTATYTITATSSGFTTPISLSESGAPSGSTISFRPSKLAAPGSAGSTLTINLPRNVAPGTRTITITATGGGISNNATTTLIIF